MQLKNLHKITATVVCETGLHVGGNDDEMHIGGIDNPVIKHPITNEPYIPGSSLKGKMRAMLEWRSGFVKEKPLDWQDYKQSGSEAVLDILRLFGMSAGADLTLDEAGIVGPTRASFWDLALDPAWVREQHEARRLLTEAKSENVINRINGTAEHPRQTERVPSGARFLMTLTLKDLGDDERLMKTLLAGLKLVEFDGIGGSLSRGYGKVRFDDLKIDGNDATELYRSIDPFRPL